MAHGATKISQLQQLEATLHKLFALCLQIKKSLISFFSQNIAKVITPYFPHVFYLLELLF